MIVQPDILTPQDAATGRTADVPAGPRAVRRPLLGKIARKIAWLVWPRAHRFSARRSLNAIGLKDADSIKTWTRADELVTLFNLALACPRGARALEIGSYLGAATCHIAAGLAHLGGTLTCVDTWQNQTMPDGERDTYGEFLRNVAPVRDRLVLCRKSSAELEQKELNGPFHLIFLDGDHAYEAVRHDFELAASCLAENGMIAFHDILYFPGVARVVGEALSSGNWVPDGQVHNLIWIVKARR